MSKTSRFFWFRLFLEQCFREFKTNRLFDTSVECLRNRQDSVILSYQRQNLKMAFIQDKLYCPSVTKLFMLGKTIFVKERVERTSRPFAEQHEQAFQSCYRTTKVFFLKTRQTREKAIDFPSAFQRAY